MTTPDLRSRFREADPFPHLVLDDFFDRRLVDGLYRSSRALPEDAWSYHRHGKQACSNPAAFDDHSRDFFSSMAGAAIVQLLEDLSGLDGLIPDGELAGGGFHRIEPGGKLGVHVDFNRHPTRNLDRALNLILFLNPSWPESWGGALELWSADGRVQTIPVKAGRVVVFEYSEHAWHGHPTPTSSPAGWYRRSVALYYYRRGTDLARHSTIYREEAT